MPNVFIAIRKLDRIPNTGLLDVFETENDAYAFIGTASYSIVSTAEIQNLEDKLAEYKKYTKFKIEHLVSKVEYMDGKWIYYDAFPIAGQGKTLEAAKLDAECNYERALDECLRNHFFHFAARSAPIAKYLKNY